MKEVHAHLAGAGNYLAHDGDPDPPIGPSRNG